MVNKTKRFAEYGFAARFKELLSGVDGQDLEEELGTSSSAFRQWINGYTLPTCENLYKLSKYFNCTTDYLLGLDNKKNKAAFDITNQALIDLEKLISEIENPVISEIIIEALVQIFTPYHSADNKKSISIDNTLTVKIFMLVIKPMADALRLVYELIEHDSIDIHLFIAHRQLLEKEMNDSLMVVPTYFTNLMSIATKYSSSVSDDRDKKIIEGIGNRLPKAGGDDYANLLKELSHESTEGE